MLVVVCVASNLNRRKRGCSVHVSVKYTEDFFFCYGLWDFPYYSYKIKNCDFSFFFSFFWTGKANTGEVGNHQGWARIEDRNMVLYPFSPRSSLINSTVVELLSSLSLWPELTLSRTQQLGLTSAAVTALISWPINWYRLYLQPFDN